LIGLLPGLILGLAYTIGFAAIISQISGQVLASLLTPPLPILASIYQFILTFMQALSWQVIFLYFVVVIVVHFVITLVPYLICRFSYTVLAVGTPGRPVGGCPRAIWENTFRASMVSISATINVYILYLWMLPLLGIMPATNAVIIFLVLMLIALPFLFCFGVFARMPFLQIFNGWISYLYPMTWANTILGALAWLLNEIVAVLFPSAANTIVFRDFDSKTGSFVIVGGFVVNPWGMDAHTLGHFIFIASQNARFGPQVDATGLPVPTRTLSYLVYHESGHTLNSAAFGYTFTAIGGIDQSMTPGIPATGGASGYTSYAELLAESHARKRPSVPDGFWLPYYGTLDNTVTAPSPTSSATVTVNTPITLNGGTNLDVDGHPGLPMTFLWTLVSAPAGSTATIGVPAAPLIAFTPDTLGAYSFTFVVHDGIDNSNSTTVSFTAVP
jgi:hypothetical protein